MSYHSSSSKSGGSGSGSKSGGSGSKSGASASGSKTGSSGSKSGASADPVQPSADSVDTDQKNVDNSVVVCEGFDKDVSPKESTVDFSYSVESVPGTTKDDWLDQVEGDILSTLSESMLPCLGSRLKLRYLQEGSASLVGGLSSDPVDVETSACTPATEGNACTSMDGSMTIYYVSADADDSYYKDELLTLVKTNMDDGKFDSKNDVVSVKYVGPELSNFSSAVVEDNQGNGSDGLSTGAQAGIIGLAVCLALLALVIVRKRSQQDSDDSVSDYSKSRIAMVVEDGYFEEEQVRSPGTVNTTLTGIPEGDEEDSMEYKEAQYNNLGLQHSGVDVHRCNSATCPKCSQRNQISFIRTPRAPVDDYSESSI